MLFVAKIVILCDTYKVELLKATELVALGIKVYLYSIIAFALRVLGLGSKSGRNVPHASRVEPSTF